MICSGLERFQSVYLCSYPNVAHNVILNKQSKKSDEFWWFPSVKH